jgi:hypothetical protein
VEFTALPLSLGCGDRTGRSASAPEGFHVGGVSTEGKIRDAGGVDEPNRIDTYRIEDDIVEGLRRIYCYAKRVARVGVPDGGQTKTT